MHSATNINHAIDFLCLQVFKASVLIPRSTGDPIQSEKLFDMPCAIYQALS